MRHSNPILSSFVFFIFSSSFLLAGPPSRDIPPPTEWNLDYFMEGLNPNGQEIQFPLTCDPKDIRENFGSGKFTSSLGSGDQSVRGIIVQTDGSIVAAGRYNTAASSPSTDNFFVMRYFEDGSVDQGFGTSGYLIVNVSLSTRSNLAHGLLQQTNGKLVVYGKADQVSDYLADFAIMRLELNGNLDTTFFTSGYGLTSFSNSADVIRSGLQDTTGRLVMAGYAWNHPSLRYEVAIARYLTQGGLDTTFFTTGKRALQVGSNDAIIYSIKLETSGNLIGAGGAYNGSDWDFMLVRYLSNGTLDTAFFTTGKLIYTLNNGNDIAWSLNLDTLGRAVLAGESVNGSANSDFAFSRINTDGSLDTTFFTIGKVLYTLGAQNDIAYASFIMSTGQIVATGSYYNGSNKDFAIVRILSDGNLDTSFHSDGKAFEAVGSSDDVGVSISYPQGTNLIIGGRTTNGSSKQDMAIIRYSLDGSLACSGCLDQGFGTN